MKPGDFALGSEKSRAAARRLVDQRSYNKKRFTLSMDIGYVGEPTCSPWMEAEDGTLSRVCCLPEDMTLEEAEKIMAVRERVEELEALEAR
jgi:hypothetical protein